ncbi:MAG: helix-hairpin-helix domain-containing protein [bacterium]
MILGILWASIPFYGMSQVDSTAAIEDAITSFSENYNMEPDAEEVLELLGRSKKINLNRTTAEELGQISFLTQKQIVNLLAYLTRYGQVYSIYELQAIEGFDSATIQNIVPLVTIGVPFPPVKLTPGNLIRYGHHELVIRVQQLLQQQAGYMGTDSLKEADPENYYLGNPQKYYFRYRYSFTDRLIIGFSGEKDAGEQFFRGSQASGMDFYSGFLCFQNSGWLKQFIIGNFRATYGQGLTLGGNSFGSSISFGTSMTWLSGGRPSQSVREYGYLRGVALTCRTGPIEYMAFVSHADRDGSETGYHRTPSENAKRNTIQELIYGGHLSYRGNFFLIGISGYRGTWSRDYPLKPDIYHRFSLSGSRFGATGIDGRIRFWFCQLFGEFSVSQNGGIAGIAGISSTPVSGFDLLFIYRNYGRNYQNPMATPMAQNPEPVNEQGFYLKLNLQPWSRISLTGYADLFRFPWMKYQVNGPSGGWEAGAAGRYSDARLSASLRYYVKQTQVDVSYPDLQTKPLTDNKISDLKVDLAWQVSPALSLNSLFECRSGTTGKTRQPAGYLVGQDIRYRSPGSTWGATAKFMLFDIPAYFTRIYAYEPHLPYGYASTVCIGDGIRFVLQLNWQVFRCFTVWGWLGITSYSDRNQIGSGPEEIDGNVRAEMQVQVKVKF